MTRLHIVCDYREKFPSELDGEKIYNDHISKNSLNNLIDTIHKCGYDVDYFGGVNTLIQYYQNKIPMPSGIYINLNDGLIEKHKRGQTPLLLELLKVSYSGCDAFHALLASDKYFSSLCLKQNGILCPLSTVISNIDSLNQIYSLSLPIIIKPNCEGSSIGIDSMSYCNNYDEAIRHSTDLLKSYDDVLVEEYISGYEITNLIISKKKTGEILLNEPLVIALNEQLYLNYEVFGVKEKYSNSRRYWLADQVLPKSIVTKIKCISEQIIKLLKLPNFIRIDYRVCGENIYFLEANTNPAFGITSDVGKLCKLKNMDFSDFVSVFIKSLLD